MLIESGNTDFCYECRKDTEYVLTKRNCMYEHGGKMYSFPVTTALCTGCGKEVNPPGLMDLNVDEFADWYEAKFGAKCNK